MKKILLFICAAVIAGNFMTAQVAINTDGTTPNSSAMLDIKSTTKGLLKQYCSIKLDNIV